MSWYDKMVAAGRSKSLTTGNIRRGVAAVHEVLGSPALVVSRVRRFGVHRGREERGHIVAAARLQLVLSVLL